MFKFAHPEIIYALLIVPFLMGYHWYYRLRRNKALENFGDPELMGVLMPEYSRSRPIVKFYLLLVAITTMILVMAGPQFGSKLQKTKRKGIEIMLALDVSNSMMAEDIKPNRLEKSKQAISKMVNKLNQDKIGMIVFAGDAYTQLPITTDYVSAKMFLSSINTGIVPTQGTAIGSAIRLAARSFGPESDATRVIIIITDGENHEDDAVEAAKDAKENGMIVYTIGMGLPKGAPIPISGTRNFHKDKSGNVVISKLDKTMLNEIAMAGGGSYIQANNTTTGLNSLFKEISKLDKTELEARSYSDYEEQYNWLAWLALALLIAEFLVMERKNKYLKNIHIFK